MIKKTITMFLFITIVGLLSGCSINRLSKEQLFEKKKECNNYSEEILNSGEGYVNEVSLKEIFYSPTENTCMYVFENAYQYYIYDILSKKEIYEIQSPYTACGGIEKVFSVEYENCEEPITRQFDNKIKQLKGE